MNAASEYIERIRLLVEQNAPEEVALPMMAIGAVGFIVMGMLGWKMFGATLEEVQSGSPLLRGIEVPRAAITWVLPYGLTLLSLQFLRMAYRGVAWNASQADANIETGI